MVVVLAEAELAAVRAREPALVPELEEPARLPGLRADQAERVPAGSNRIVERAALGTDTRLA